MTEPPPACFKAPAGALKEWLSQRLGLLSLDKPCDEEREFRGGAICCVGTDVATWTLCGYVYQIWLNAERWKAVCMGNGKGWRRLVS